jgi:hypothetical protein
LGPGDGVARALQSLDALREETAANRRLAEARTSRPLAAAGSPMGTSGVAARLDCARKSTGTGDVGWPNAGRRFTPNDAGRAR